MNNGDNWVNDLLNDLRQNSFYGKIVLELKQGQIVLIRREETIKPPEVMVNIRDKSRSTA